MIETSKSFWPLARNVEKFVTTWGPGGLSSTIKIPTKTLRPDTTPTNRGVDLTNPHDEVSNWKILKVIYRKNHPRMIKG